MSPATLQHELEAATSRLIALAIDLTWNTISNNCKFILSEITNTEKNFFEQQRIRKKENDKKNSVALQDIIPALQNLYSNLYDINLYIYRAEKKLTIIEIGYYLKSSLGEDHRLSVIDKEPMLHCKVAIPPWLDDKKEKFDINWEHNKISYYWKMFLLRHKLKTKRLLK